LCLDIPDLKTDLHRVLLGPLSLATEIYGALFPGCVFTALLCVKRGWLNRVLSYPLLGYKTKIILALFASYIVGKLVLSIITLSADMSVWFRRRAKRQKEVPQQPEGTSLLVSLLNHFNTLVEQSPDVVQAFLGGIAAGPFLTGKSQGIEHYSAMEAGAIFYLSTGVVFISSAAIPGDGNWRVVEATIGVILLARGLKSWFARDEMAAGLIGAALHDYLTGLQPGQLSAGLKSVWNAVTVLSKTPAPSAKPVTPDTPSVPATTEKAAATAVGKN